MYNIVMKFIKENWFKISLLILFLFCILLAFLYTTKQQNIEKQNQISNLNNACEKSASKKKEEIKKNDTELYIGTYEYKYNLIYSACILAYTGNYFGTSLAGVFGHDLFRIDNLSTGESIMNTQVDPGDSYRETSEKFNNLKKQYIGSITPVN